MTSFWKVLYLLLPAVLVQAGADGGGQCGVQGQCAEGLLLELGYTDSLSSCIIQGKQVEGSAFVSWKPLTQGLCEVFDSCEEIDSDMNTVTSSVDCEVCHVVGSCVGHIETEAIVKGEGECGQLCLETPTCAWFTYLEDPQYCLIFDACLSLTTACSDCYSSMQSCLKDSSTTPMTTSTTLTPTPAPPAMNKIFYIDGETGKTTLVSLDGSQENCALPDYPANTNSPAALTYINGEVLACGQQYLYESNKCYKFDGSSWSPVPNSGVGHCHFDSPSVAVPGGGWWILGRRQTGDAYSCDPKVTSEIYTGVEWIPGPAYPRDKYAAYPCLVNLNANQTMLIGGYDFSEWYMLNEVWSYDWMTEEWAQTAPLAEPRQAHGCVSLGGSVLVAGGIDGDGVAFRSVELFDGSSWSPQPDLPGFMNEMGDVKSDGSILLNMDGLIVGLFKDGDAVYKRSVETGEWSRLLGPRLPEQFGGAAKDKAVLVPEDFAPACI